MSVDGKRLDSISICLFNFLVIGETVKSVIYNVSIELGMKQEIGMRGVRSIVSPPTFQRGEACGLSGVRGWDKE